MEAVRYHNNKCISRVHLVQSIHEEGVGGVVQDEQKHDCRFVFALCTVDQSYRPMLHLTCSQSLGMNIVQLLDFEGCLSRYCHRLSFSKQKDRLLIFEQLSQLHTLLFAVTDNFRDISGHLLEFFPYRLNQLHRRTIFLLCHFSGESDQVEHLMEEALGCSHAGLPSHFDVDREIHFSGQSGALYIYDTDCVDFLLVFEVIHDAYQIFCLARLADYNHCFILSDVVGVQLGWVSYVELLKTFQCFEKRLTSISREVAGATGDHAEVGTEADCLLDPIEIRFERNGRLLPYFIVVEEFMRLGWLLQNFSLVVQLDQPVFVLLLEGRNVVYTQLEYFSIVGRQVTVGVGLEGDQF